MGKKVILLHHHIFKNAGSTIDAILSRNFGTVGAVKYDKPIGEKGEHILNNNELVEILRMNPKCISFSSHQFNLSEFNSSDFEFVDMAFVRHPLDRLSSIYYFYNSNPSLISNLADTVRKQSLINFMSSFVRGEHAWLGQSSQTWIFATHFAEKYTLPTRHTLHRAIERAKSVLCLGVVEKFDESTAYFEHALVREFGSVDFSYEVINKSSGRKNTLQERLNDLRETLGAELYDQLLALNQLDLELWEYCQVVVDRRLRNYRVDPARVQKMRLSSRSYA